MDNFEKLYIKLTDLSLQNKINVYKYSDGDFIFTKCFDKKKILLSSNIEIDRFEKHFCFSVEFHNGEEDFHGYSLCLDYFDNIDFDKYVNIFKEFFNLKNIPVQLSLFDL